MVTAAIVVHIIVCIALVIVVLLQQGKGADVGAVFGGSSQTVFGAGGASSPLFKLTVDLCAALRADVVVSGLLLDPAHQRQYFRRSQAPAAGDKRRYPAVPLEFDPDGCRRSRSAPASNPAAPAPAK